MKKVLVDKNLFKDILEARDAIFGLSFFHGRKLKKLLKQTLPTPEEYVEIYKNKPFWTYSGSYGLGAGTFANKHTCIQKLLVDTSFIHELISQQFNFFGLKDRTICQLIQILEKDIVSPYEYTEFYNQEHGEKHSGVEE